MAATWLQICQLASLRSEGGGRHATGIGGRHHRNTHDREKRRKIFEQADDSLMEQVGIIPLYFGDKPYRWGSKRIAVFNSPILGFSKVEIGTLSLK